MNEGNSVNWYPGTKRYIDYLKSDNRATGHPYSLRYIGTAVADVHRTLLYGGVFLYPADRKSPAGKLRLLYEASPMAYLFEQAGGTATNGVDRILDLVPRGLHDRTPLVLGSRRDARAFRDMMIG